MKKILLLTLLTVFIITPTFAYQKKYIKNNKGQTTGYTRSYANGTTKQYNKKGQLEYTYKKSSNGTVTKYAKNGRKLETYK